MSDKYRKQAEKLEDNPTLQFISFVIFLFFLELAVLGNLWAINAIADYF